MKVTLLAAMCTLVVLLHQMQTPMAMPQLSPGPVDRPFLVDDFSESIVLHEQ